MFWTQARDAEKGREKTRDLGYCEFSDEIRILRRGQSSKRKSLSGSPSIVNGGFKLFDTPFVSIIGNYNFQMLSLDTGQYSKVCLNLRLTEPCTSYYFMVI